MNIPEIQSYEDLAISTVVSVINKAQEKLGVRNNLFEYANTFHKFGHQLLSLSDLGFPLAITSEKFIKHTIEKKWRLTDALMYIIKYHGTSDDECSQYYYYEVIFSQPTAAHPVPQTTTSVFFRVEEKYVDPPKIKGVPTMHFRIEGQHTDHDVRYTKLTLDWILAVMQMKLKFFQRLEKLDIF
ncbi:uncharacterized protein LOC113231076 [Hyposmocoma kahamanoa]|uniref:uncharacterized protein LOC113231076 n=1 Tax=Hyposmocoma kahamanoa TaxID=1477025 RepID=UPI000E6D923E|nr:uncharacterized protein LOC113231076 [Hyposmocoma kahamanoa]